MELKDKLVSRFSNLVARELGMHEWNEGKIGAGNDFIQRTVFNAVLGNKLHHSTSIRNQKEIMHEYPNKPLAQKGNFHQRYFEADNVSKGKYQQTIQSTRQPYKDGKPQLVVCMWSGINRHEILRKSQITSDWSWTIGTWAKFLLDPKSLKALPQSIPYVDNQLVAGDKVHLEEYLKVIRNAHMNLRLTIGNMLSVKYFLEAQGIHQLHYLFSHGQYRPLLPILDWEVYENTNNWWESLDMNRKQIVTELPFLESQGFYDMACNNGKPIGAKDHPLEAAHAMMAERIIRDIETNEFFTKDS